MAINRIKRSKTFDCFASLAMTQDCAMFINNWRCDFSRTHYVIASEWRERGNQRAKKLDNVGQPNAVDCFALLAMTIGIFLRFQIKPNQILTSTLGLLGYTRGLLILRILLLRESESLFALSSVDFDSALDSVLESSL